MAQAEAGAGAGLFYFGAVKQAQEFAKRAQNGLKAGSPDWVKADDIINFKPADLTARKSSSHQARICGADLLYGVHMTESDRTKTRRPSMALQRLSPPRCFFSQGCGSCSGATARIAIEPQVPRPDRGQCHDSPDQRRAIRRHHQGLSGSRSGIFLGAECARNQDGEG